MKLRDLEAEFIKHLGGGSFQAAGSLAEADGVCFLCPKCFVANGGAPGTHSVICWFVGRVPADIRPGPGRWMPRGTGIDDLSFVPTPPKTPSVQLTSGCHWHGFVRDGEAA